MATALTQPGTANVLQATDALTIALTVPTLPDGMLCILVTEAGFGGTIASIVDSAGHNYMTNLHQSTDPVNNNFSAFSYVNNCQGYTGGKIITVTWTAPMHAYLRLFWYLQGEMALDQWDVTHLSAPTGSFSGATLTPKYEGSLIFSYVASHAAGGDIAVSSLAGGAGFRTISGSSGTDAAEDLVQATIAPIAATWTSDINSRNSVWTLVFRPYGWMQNNDPNNYIFTGTTTHYSFPNGPVSTGNMVLVFFGWNDATVDAPVLSDNATGATNSYTVLAPLTPPDAHVWYVAYCNNVRGHPTQINIVTQHSVSGAILTQIVELGGSWIFDSFDKRKSGPTPGNYPLGAVTPARNGALIYAVSVMYGTADTTRVSGPFRRTFTGVIEPATMIQSSAAAITPTYNSTDAQGVASFVVAFTPPLQLPIAAGLVGGSNLALALSTAMPTMATLQGASAMALPDLQQQIAPMVTPPPPVSFFANTVTARDIAAFRSKFVSLASVDDASVAGMFDIVNVEMGNGDNWPSQDDFQLARLALCAHLTIMEQLQVSTALLGGIGMSDVFVRTIRFGERLVGFAQRKAFENIEQTAGPGEALLSSTSYGQLFIRLRARNIIPVGIV